MDLYPSLKLAKMCAKPGAERDALPCLQLSPGSSRPARGRHDRKPRGHLSWSVNIIYNFIHSFIHSFGGVRISWQFVGIVNRGSEQNALVSLTLFVTPKPLLTSNAKRPTRTIAESSKAAVRPAQALRYGRSSHSQSLISSPILLVLDSFGCKQTHPPAFFVPVFFLCSKPFNR